MRSVRPRKMEFGFADAHKFTLCPPLPMPLTECLYASFDAKTQTGNGLQCRFPTCFSDRKVTGK